MQYARLTYVQDGPSGCCRARQTYELRMLHAHDWQNVGSLLRESSDHHCFNIVAKLLMFAGWQHALRIVLSHNGDVASSPQLFVDGREEVIAEEDPAPSA